jgi:glutamate dehydrogenase
LAVLLAYAKMSLDAELLASDLPDLPELAGDLIAYFPRELQDPFAAQIATHPLRREIAATVVANDLVNRAGLTFVHDLAAQTGRTAPEIARAYRIVREVFDLPALWAAIEGLDGTVAARVQVEMLRDIAGLVEHEAAWLLRNSRLDLGRETARFATDGRRLAAALDDLLPEAERARLDARAGRLAEAGVPDELSRRLASIPFLLSALEIVELGGRTQAPVERAAQVYYAVGARFALDDMRAAARRLPAETSWQKEAAEAVIDDLFAVQADFAALALNHGNGAGDPVAAWANSRAAALAPAEAIAADLRAAASAPDLAMLVVATRQLRQAAGEPS